MAEFGRLLQPAGGVRQELQHGELVELPPAKKLHTKLRRRLVDLLATVLDPAQHGVDKEFPFWPAPEYEVWVADVAVFSLTLWEQTADDDYFQGVPAIVIEVLSPSNSASDMLEREEACLRNGGEEFWLVDPKEQVVKVVRADAKSSVHSGGSVIESAALSRPIKVADLWVRQSTSEKRGDVTPTLRYSHNLNRCASLAVDDEVGAYREEEHLVAGKVVAFMTNTRPVSDGFERVEQFS